MSRHPALWFAALCLSPAAVWAAPPQVAVIVSSAQPAIEVVGQGARTLGAAEFAELRGEYRLANGGSLAVGGARHRPEVALNHHAPLALQPAGPNTLASADVRLRLVFKAEANGEISALTLHVAPGLL